MTSTHSPQTDIWSLGVLIIQIMTETGPLSLSQPVLKDNPDAASLRNRIAGYNFQEEHAHLLATEGILKSIVQIVRGCHALRPSLRPSAAYITEQLFDIWSSGVLQTPPSSVDPEAAKDAVTLALETHTKQPTLENNSGYVAPNIDPVHWSSLEEARSNGDPLASALIGQAIWRGLQPPGIEESQVVLARGRNPNESKG